MSECPHCRPAVLGDSGPGPRDRGVDQLSWVTRSSVQGPTVSNRCPGRLGPQREILWGLPAVQGDSRSVPKPADSTSGPWGLRPMYEVLRGRPAVPRDLFPVPRARSVDQLPRDTRACFGGPAVSTSSPGRIAIGSECLRGRPSVPGEFGPCRWVRGVNQLSRATWARFRGPTVSTSCPGRLRLVFRSRRGRRGPVSKGLQFRPDVPGDSGQCPRARGDDHLS